MKKFISHFNSQFKFGGFYGRQGSLVNCQTGLYQTDQGVAYRALSCFSSLVSSNSKTNQMDSQSRVCKIAVGQMTATNDTSLNLTICHQLIKEASEQSARVLFLPECFSFIGNSSAQSVAIAQNLDGNIIKSYQSLAKQYGIWLSLGGFQEKTDTESHIYNTHVMVDDRGSIVATYRKVHLFDADVQGGPRLLESSFTKAGDKFSLVDSPCGRIGLTICYDVRFPHMYQQLAKLGAQLITVPSAFTRPTGEAHWEVLLRARAIETQCYVVAAAQAGVHNEKRQSFGHSIVIDPWGKVISCLRSIDECGLIYADIDLDLVADVRQRMPVAQHAEAGRQQLGL